MKMFKMCLTMVQPVHIHNRLSKCESALVVYCFILEAHLQIMMYDGWTQFSFSHQRKKAATGSKWMESRKKKITTTRQKRKKNPNECLILLKQVSRSWKSETVMWRQDDRKSLALRYGITIETDSGIAA